MSFSQAPLGPDPPNVGQTLLPCRPKRVARTTVLAGQWPQVECWVRRCRRHRAGMQSSDMVSDLAIWGGTGLKDDETARRSP